MHIIHRYPSPVEIVLGGRFNIVCQETDELSDINSVFYLVASFGGISSLPIPSHKSFPFIKVVYIHYLKVPESLGDEDVYITHRYCSSLENKSCMLLINSSVLDSFVL